MCSRARCADKRGAGFHRPTRDFQHKTQCRKHFMQRITGYVTRWDERGYGWIHRDDIGGELFVHGSELTGRTVLKPGENVEFDLAHEEKITTRTRTRAVSVNVLDKAPE
jgi:cold shock CspA family protein